MNQPSLATSRVIEYYFPPIVAIYSVVLFLALEFYRLQLGHCVPLQNLSTWQACQQSWLINYLHHPYLPPSIIGDLQHIQTLWTLPALILASFLVPPFRRFLLLALGPLPFAALAMICNVGLFGAVAISSHDNFFTTGLGYIGLLLAADCACIGTYMLLWQLLYAYRWEREQDRSVAASSVRLQHKMLTHRLGGVLPVRDWLVVAWWLQLGPFVCVWLIAQVGNLLPPNAYGDATLRSMIQATSGLGFAGASAIFLMTIPVVIVILALVLLNASHPRDDWYVGRVVTIITRKSDAWVVHPPRWLLLAGMVLLGIAAIVAVGTIHDMAWTVQGVIIIVVILAPGAVMALTDLASWIRLKWLKGG